MRISYDPEADALYIRLLEGKYECRTVRLNLDIATLQQRLENDGAVVRIPLEERRRV